MDTRSALPARYAIVGAGPAGLVTARAFLKRGLDVEILERFDEPGGIWNIEQPGSPMYRSCNFISSREYGGFIGYPMPEDYPMYPKWTQIRDYVQAFARDFGLNEKIRTNANVVHAEPVDSEAGRYWRVTLESGEVNDYRGIVVATGAQWDPFIPEIPGLDGFEGRAIHSAEYLETGEFVGKRVLVVGAGNSGVDIVSDAAVHADKAFLSTRRGYWFLPKFLYGLPVPDLLAGTVEIDPEGPLGGLSTPEVFKTVLDSVGDLTVYGLPAPDHELGASHPILNNQVLHCLAHGLLEYRPDIASIDGSTVNFVDGRQEEIDVIVFATGYDVKVPWLPEGILEYKDGHPESVMGSFIPDQLGLYIAGALHFAGNTFSIFDRTVQVVAADAEAEVTGRNADAMREIRETFRPNLQGDFPFLDTRRNANQVFIPALEAAFDELESRYGIAIPKFGDQEFYADLRVRDAALA